ncbi:MAG: O-antigen ligase family protein [Crocinitomicaceae bacterium]|nr:O-antigen ligase family protein [Crocinitomicaceae bacterium]
MIRLYKNRDWYGLGLFFLLIILVGYQEMVSPAIGIFAIIVIIEGLFFKTLEFKFNKHTFIFIILFLFYLAGLIWSDHRDIGWKLMEYKMAFFIFPLLFAFRKKLIDHDAILTGLIWGATLLTSRLLVGYFEYPNLTFYDISRSVVNMHPTYTSIYLTLASFLLVYFNYGNKFSYSKVIDFIGVFLFSALVLFIGSMAGILFLGLTLFFGAAVVVFNHFKKMGLIIYLIIFPILFVFAFLKMDKMQYDIEMIESVYKDLGDGKQFFIEKNRLENSGVKQRVISWCLAAEIIYEHPMGVGTGDIDFVLMEKYDKYRLLALKNQNLNPHNQFLSNWN